MANKILFPAGAGGNHIRWLLFLDPSFKNIFDDGVNKLEFIKNNVYNKSRTWDNWLEYEWRYRNQLNQLIQIGHAFEDIEVKENDRILLCTVTDTKFIADRYFHFNLGANNLLPAKAEKDYANWFSGITWNINKLKNIEILKLDAKILFENTLNYDFYNSVVSFFNLENNYEQANIVHQLYIEADKQAKKEFVDFFKSNIFQNYLTMLSKESK